MCGAEREIKNAGLLKDKAIQARHFFCENSVAKGSKRPALHSSCALSLDTA